jgi:hypothetical protein
MRILEIVLLCLVVVALIMFFTLMPGGASVLMIVLSLLSLIYFGFGFILFSKVGFRAALKQGLKNTPTATIVIGVVTGVVLSQLAIGILFKLLLMPGANEMLMVGNVGSAVMLVVNVFYWLRYRSASSKLCISRLVMFLIPAVFLFTTSQLTLVKWQYKDHPGYVEAFRQFSEDPSNEEKWQALDLEQNRIHMTAEEFELYKKSVER